MTEIALAYSSIDKARAEGRPTVPFALARELATNPFLRADDPTLQAFVDAGAKLVDTAPAYGNAEANLGQLIEDLGIRNRIFLATKVPAQDSREQKEASIAGSLQRMRTRNFDLMQAWNVTDANHDLGLIKEWKAQKICRYTGITSSFDAAYDALEQVIRREKPDFFQINYSLADRDAEARRDAQRHDPRRAVDLGVGPFLNRLVDSIVFFFRFCK